MPFLKIDLPEELHRRCKIAAVNKGVTLKAFVLEALEQAAPETEKSK